MSLKRLKAKFVSLLDSTSVFLTFVSVWLFLQSTNHSSTITGFYAYCILLLIILLPSLGGTENIWQSLLSISDAFWPSCAVLMLFLLLTKSIAYVVVVSILLSHFSAVLYIASLTRRGYAGIAQLMKSIAMIAVGGLLAVVVLAIYNISTMNVVSAVVLSILHLVLQCSMVICLNRLEVKQVIASEEERLLNEGTSDADRSCDE